MPLGLSIYLSKKQAPHFFCSPPHAFGGFLKGEKWHAEPDFTPVSGKNSRENGPQMASSGIFLAFPPAYLYISAENERLAPQPQPIYLSLEIPCAPLKVPYGLWLRSAAEQRQRGFNPQRGGQMAAPATAGGPRPSHVHTTCGGDWQSLSRSSGETRVPLLGDTGCFFLLRLAD